MESEQIKHLCKKILIEKGSKKTCRFMTKMKMKREQKEKMPICP